MLIFGIIIFAFLIIIIVFSTIMAILTASNQRKRKKAKKKNTTKIDVTYIQDNKSNTITRSDNKPIPDEEIPGLIESGYKKAIEYEKQSPNIKFHRTAKEEDLSFNFEMNHGHEIGKHIRTFEDCYRKAFSEKDINKKIVLLEQTIYNFEKAKKWFYQTKGGMIYFQDMYEHLHNSRNDDYSYIDQVEDELDASIDERDYIIPKMLEIIRTSSDGILQKDIYQHLPDVPRIQIQNIVRNFESEGLISKEKSKGSYLLTIKEEKQTNT